MRIIAGSAKGRRLKAPPRHSLMRPILSRIRQSLFDTIRPKVMACHFLDLYAGTGIVGLEAISRGANFVAFVEQSREGLRLIESNVKILSAADKTSVMSGDVLGGALNLLRARLAPDFLFDLVFLSPPYLGEDRRGAVLVMSIPTLERLKEANLLSSGAWVIIQHHQKEPMAFYPIGFHLIKKVKFGESFLTYLKWEPKGA